MAKIQFTDGPIAKVKVRTIFDILGVPDGGASPTGSTYYKTLFSCPREFALWKIAQIERDPKAEALTTGWLWHYCLETYYKKIQEWQVSCKAPKTSDEYLFGGNKKAMDAAYCIVQELADQEGYEDMYRKIMSMLTFYFTTYDRLDRWRIIAVEETLIYKSGLFEYSVRIDLIVEDLDRGGMWIIEHKSAAALTADLLEGYQLDLQILGQVWILPKTLDLKQYPPFLGALINIVTKPKTQNSAIKVARPEVNPNRMHQEAFVRSVSSWIRLRPKFAEEKWPQALGHCAGAARGYSRCQFYDICHGFPQLSVKDWQRAKDLPHGYKRKEEPADGIEL